MTEKQLQSYAHEFRERVTGFASDYARYVLVPRILADNRRRAGDPMACPSDYHCLCEIDCADAMPLCKGRRANCKFAHRKPPPSPFMSKDLLRFRLQRAEQEKILKSLPFDDCDRLIGELRSMNRQITTALRRIHAATGCNITRNITGWM
jgi:hypothetical protein